MLSYKMVGKHILEVTETLHSFTDTKVSYCYYDLLHKRKSSTGKRYSVPDIPMSDNDLKWVETYYLPKVGVTFES
jgi:hypothetical protein